MNVRINYPFLFEKINHWIYTFFPVVFLLVGIVISLCPFFEHSHHSGMWYATAASYFSFFSVYLVPMGKKVPLKETSAYSILSILILGAGVVAFFYFRDVKIATTPFELFLMAQYGAMLGILGGAVIFDKIFNQKQK